MNQETKKSAKALFEKTAYDKLWVNPGGEFFSRKNYCENSLKEGQTCRLITKADVADKGTSTKDEEKGMNAKDTIAAIEAVKTLEDLDALLPVGESRKTVLEAADKKREELTLKKD